jgi:hypothetical protein
MVLVEKQRLETEPQSEGSEASLPPPLPYASVCEPLSCHAAASIYDEVVLVFNKIPSARLLGSARRSSF